MASRRGGSATGQHPAATGTGARAKEVLPRAAVGCGVQRGA